MCKITGDHVVMGDSTRPLRWRSVLVVLSCWGAPPTQITLPICQSKTTYEITTSQLSTVGGGGQIQVSSMTELILFVLQFQQACTLARMLIWIVLEIVNKWSQSHSKMSDHKLSTRTFSTKASSRHEFFFFFNRREVSFKIIGSTKISWPRWVRFFFHTWKANFSAKLHPVTFSQENEEKTNFWVRWAPHHSTELQFEVIGDGNSVDTGPQTGVVWDCSGVIGRQTGVLVDSGAIIVSVKTSWQDRTVWTLKKALVVDVLWLCFFCRDSGHRRKGFARLGRSPYASPWNSSERRWASVLIPGRQTRGPRPLVSKPSAHF